MQLTVTTIIFGLSSGQRVSQVRLTLPSTVIRTNELISYKILQEIAECRAQQRPGLSGEYLTAEELLQAPEERVGPGSAPDEIRRAHKAFATRGFMIVIDNRQIQAQDEELTLSSDTRVEFIKILPMVGG